ncbi:hypothetical protein ACFXPR_02485 [Nocardia tengchongensis]|uniref:hypothetical protein n=1 Tax=Nocardia tengchongensis TaxID=2055889 RepID=UPI00369B5A4C
MQNPRTAFQKVAVLRTGNTVLNAQGMPSVASGGFAATFKIETPDGQRFAVRCFHKQGHTDRRLAERYDHIHRFIAAHPRLKFLLDAAYHDDGIVVNGAGHPAVQMRWAEGEMLGVWVEDWIEDPTRSRAAIGTVRAGITLAITSLHRAGAAHGDLQHGNILVGDDLSITLIDYDGMYLSTFAATTLPAIEQGHRNYQHPGRGTRFDLGIDAFAAAVIDVSLLALQHQPSLWDDFGGTGENLIFTARDFVDPDNSPVFAALADIPAVADSAARLQRACRTDYDYIDAVLAGRTMTGPAVGRFALATGEIVHGLERQELLRRAGETVTVYGTVRFATVVKGADGRDVALINLGDFTKGDFTIVAYDEVARKLYADYGNMVPHNKRRMRQLHGWQVAITGTVVIYVNRGTHVPQIELARARLLRNLTADQIADLAAPPSSAQHPTPPSAPQATDSKPTITPPAHPAVGQRFAKPPAPLPDRTAEQADRQARLSELYKNFPIAPPTAVVRQPPPPRLPASAPTTSRSKPHPSTSRARPATPLSQSPKPRSSVPPPSVPTAIPPAYPSTSSAQTGPMTYPVAPAFRPSRYPLAGFEYPLPIRRRRPILLWLLLAILGAMIVLTVVAACHTHSSRSASIGNSVETSVGSPLRVD